MVTVYVAKTGNDANPGTDPAAPKLTLGTAVVGALAAIPSFDGIEHVVEILDSETYAETNVSLKGSGGWAKWVTVRGAVGQLPTIDGGGTVAAPAFLCSNFQTPAAGRYQKVHRIRFTAFNGSGAGKGVIATGNSLEVADVLFDACAGPGVNYVNGSAVAPARVLRCVARDGGPLVFQNAGTDWVHVENCLAYGTGSAKIATVGVNSHVYFCTEYNTNPAVSLKGIESYTIRNCISVRGGGAEIGTVGIVAQPGGTVAYSLSYGWNTAYSGTQGASCLTDDPLFTNAAGDDFTLQEASPAINAGTDVGVVDDLLGALRPQGGGFDLGAYEAAPISTTVSGVTVLGPTSLRVTLAALADSDASWSNLANYTLTQTLPQNGVVPLLVSATPGGANTDYIVLVTSEHTDGQGYNLAVAGLTHVIDGNANYVGQGDPPAVASRLPQSSTTLRVAFDEAMANNAALADPASYVITPVGPGAGLVVTQVTVLDATTVELTHEASLAGQSYTLEVSGPQDAALNPMVGDTGVFIGVLILNGAYFTSTTIVTFSEDGLPLENEAKVWQPVLQTLFVSDRRLLVTLPARDPGTVFDLRVTCGTRQVKKKAGYRYP